jgi:hypothetical protein
MFAFRTVPSLIVIGTSQSMCTSLCGSGPSFSAVQAPSMPVKSLAYGW